jgi:hypothetical protein
MMLVRFVSGSNITILGTSQLHYPSFYFELLYNCWGSIPDILWLSIYDIKSLSVILWLDPVLQPTDDINPLFAYNTSVTPSHKSGYVKLNPVFFDPV